MSSQNPDKILGEYLFRGYLPNIKLRKFEMRLACYRRFVQLHGEISLTKMRE